MKFHLCQNYQQRDSCIGVGVESIRKWKYFNKEQVPIKYSSRLNVITQFPLLGIGYIKFLFPLSDLRATLCGSYSFFQLKIEAFVGRNKDPCENGMICRVIAKHAFGSILPSFYSGL